MHAGIEHGHEQFDQLRTASAEALGQYIGAQQQHGARLALRERLTDPARMAAHQVHLQLRQLLRRNAHVRQLAEASIDAVDRLAGGQNPLDQVAAGNHAHQG